MIAFVKSCAPLLLVSALLVSVSLVAGSTVNAQPASTAAKGQPNALQGFSQNRNEPVHIESATLEVRDKEKIAAFSGDVRVKQGDTGMRCKTLLVFYDQDAAGDGGKSMPAAQPGPGGEQKIKRLEARGAVVVTQKDQTATGDLGIFDMRTNTVTLTGNVVMTQGKNVLRGERLVVDMTTGVSRVDAGKSGRVQMLAQPGSQTPDAAAKPGTQAPGQGSGPLRSPVPVKPFN